MNYPRHAPYTIERFKILVGGYINVNVVDGSAFFLAGFLSMCGRHPGVQADLVTANPIQQTEVLDEVLGSEDVRVFDPYFDAPFQSMLERPHGTWMTRSHYAKCLQVAYQSQSYDAILIRDNEVADHFVRLQPDAAERLSVYVTGLTFTHTDADSHTVDTLRSLSDAGVRFACQTETIRELLLTAVPGVEKSKTFILPPHVPDGNAVPCAPRKPDAGILRLTYTGKFFEHWNVDKILAGFKSVRSDGAALRLDVAGGEFRNSERNPNLVANVRYLLETTPGVHWHGKVPRRVARRLISASDVGIGWRSPELDRSSELSTKILEYGALGKPSILNRTSMHEALLGRDYPLFVSSMTDYLELLTRLPEMTSEIAEAGRRSFEASRPHWYSNVLRALLPALSKDQEVIPESTGRFPLARLYERASTVSGVRGQLTLRGDLVEAAVTQDPHAVALDEAMVELEAYCRWHSAVARRGSEQFRDSNATVSGRTNPASPNSSTTRNTDKAKHDAREAELVEKVRVLVLELESARARADANARSLETLRQSPLGRIQRWVWRVMRGFRRK